MSEFLDRLTRAINDRYAIKSELGRGGMALVYLAEDLKHERKVALKVLLPQLAAALGGARFLQEIRVTANLHHPHILPLYDSGEADNLLYYVMPYVKGESLRDRLNRETQLPIDQALKITEHVASALDYAHRHGVVHRDIKPENILLHDGMALVADFGIALAVKSAGGERLTETGLSLGTPAYMSPEQVAGERELDARSDVYSLACVLYEMLAGSPPFTGATAQIVLARHVTDPVPPITTARSSVPHTVAASITKALGKAPADRFDSVRSFADSLLPTVVPLVPPAANTASEDKSIVVLPFDNLSSDPENAFFADGLTEEITADLSRVPALRVVSKYSAVQVRQKGSDARNIGRELDVRYVLEGSVRRAGNDLRITAQLIDAPTNAHVWAETYAGTLQDVFGIQEQVARSIVNTLELRLTKESKRTGSVEAYDAYLKGCHHLNRMTNADVSKAIGYFEQAIAIDSDFPQPYAALGDALVRFAGALGDIAQPEVVLRAREAAEHALELDPDLAEAHVTLGMIASFHDWDRATATTRFQRAIVSNPNMVHARVWYASHLLFLELDPSAALEEIQVAERLDPLDLLVKQVCGIVHLYGSPRRRDEAIAKFREIVELEPHHAFGHYWLSYSYLDLGDNERAVAEIEQAVMLSEGSSVHLIGARGFIHARTGAESLALEAIGELKRLRDRGTACSSWIARVYAGLGDWDSAFLWLDQAIAEHDMSLCYCAMENEFETAYGDPRFRDLLRRMGFDVSKLPGTQAVEDTASDDKSIVVLPFDNLSPDPDNEYFADGLTEELISEFTKIAALRVISRTSSMHYKRTDKDLRTIAEELSVRFVIEGSVRKSGSNLRITAQLIDADSDAHLWAEKYSGTLEDIFEFQERVARSIVDELRVTLSPEEERRIRERPTESLEAYDCYLRGLDVIGRGFLRTEYAEAQRMFEQAVQRDPRFAQALCALSRVHTGMYHIGYDRTEQRLTRARSAVDRALALQPELPEAHSALGMLHWTLLDHGRAIEHLRVGIRHQPNDSQLWRLMGLTRMWEGDWEEGRACQEKAMWLDPRNPVHSTNVAACYRITHDYANAEPYYERAIDVSPDWIASYVELAYLYLEWKGDTGLARTCLKRAEDAGASEGWLAPLLRVQLELFDGNFVTALERLAAWESDEVDIVHGYTPRVLMSALTRLLCGDSEEARLDFLEAESIARAKVELQPQDARVHSTLGIALAGLGAAEEAIAEGIKFETLAPVSKDGLAPYRVYDLARIYALLGQPNAAVDQLEHLLSIPAPHSARFVALDPIWSLLGEHPRFQELLQSGGVSGRA